jgi:uncharacterized protein YodC (DUF2158 family)
MARSTTANKTEGFQFQNGDIVRLKTEAGPRMVVSKVDNANKDVDGLWWSDTVSEFKVETFPVSTLMKVK